MSSFRPIYYCLKIYYLLHRNSAAPARAGRTAYMLKLHFNFTLRRVRRAQCRHNVAPFELIMPPLVPHDSKILESHVHY